MLSVDFAGGLSGKGELTLRAPLSGTFLQRKDVVNQCLEFGVSSVRAESGAVGGDPPQEVGVRRGPTPGGEGQAGTHPRRWGSGWDPPQEVGARRGKTGYVPNTASLLTSRPIRQRREPF